MKRAVKIVLVLLAVLVTLPVLWLSSCVLRVANDAVHEGWNQKMVLVIERPGGELRADAVQHIEWSGWTGGTRDALSSLQGAKTSWKVTGEAVVAEIAPGKYLFALLKAPTGFIGDPGKNLAYAVIRAQKTGGYVSTPETIERVKALPVGLPVPVPPDAWPLLVTFDNIADPKTVRQVDPADLEASFGPGVRLKAVTLEVTGEPVTEGRVEGALRWMATYKKNQWRLNGEKCVACPVSSDRFADLIHPSDFLIWGK